MAAPSVIPKNHTDETCQDCKGEGRCQNCNGTGWIGEIQYVEEMDADMGDEPCNCCEEGECYACGGHGYLVWYDGTLLQADHPVFN